MTSTDTLTLGPYLLLYVGLVGFFAFAAAYHLVLWFTSRSEPLLAVFSVDCAIRAVLCAVLVQLMSATTAEAATDAVWARIGLILATFITTLWGVRLIGGVRATPLVWSLTGLSAVPLLIHVFVMPLTPVVVSVAQSTLPWGETVGRPVSAPPGWWVGPVYLVGFAIQGFAFHCGLRLWRRDRVAAICLFAATIGTLLIFSLEALRSFGVAGPPILGAFPSVLWVGAIAVVISRGHRRTRMQLVASEQRFRGIFDQALHFIGLLHTDGRVIETNQTSLDFAGITVGEVIGKPFWETPWWSHSPALQRRLQDAVRRAAAGEMIRFEATHPRRDGGVAHIDFSLKPVRDADGAVTLLIPEGRDITEQQEAEARRHAVEGQLAQAQKMEAIGQLAGGVAHDFNNLLTVINGYSEVLLETTPTEDTRHGMIADIADAGSRAATLTRQLLMFTRQQVVEPRALDLNGVVIENERMLRRLIGEDLRLETFLAPDLPAVRADPGQIGQVLLNLAVNARDATPPGGGITIQTSAQVLAVGESTATSGAPPPGRYVALEVSDTGQGMTEEVRAQILEPFFTTKGSGKGTGMGLATVRTIAEQSGGFLRVASAPGRGSTFTLFLPALAAPIEPRRREPVTPTSPGPRETILLVEDDEAVRSLTRQMLRGFGYQVLEAPGAARALELARHHRGTIELLLTDVVMPEVGGRELSERLLRIRPTLKVLYMSGYTDDAVVRHGVRESEVAFLQKPFTIEGLAAKVRQVLEATGSPSPREES